MLKGRKISSLMLVVTTACNLECVYCYEGEGKVRTAMTLATAMKALEMAASCGTRFHVQFTGGEPLLETDLVFRILDHIREKRWPVTTALQTNGVLLNRDCVRRLKAHGTAVGISLDGLPGIQEKLRGESAATYRAMQVLDSERVPFSVTTVLTSINTLELPGLAMALNSFPMASAVGLDLLVQKGMACDNPGIFPSDNSMICQGITALLETLDMLNKERSRPLVLREKQLLLGSLKREGTAPYCQACTGSSIAVTPDGRIYPCTQTMGDQQFLLGTLDDLRITDTAFPSDQTFIRNSCRECELQGRCPGDCPSRQYYNGRKEPDPSCAIYRTIYDYCKKTGEIPI